MSSGGASPKRQKTEHDAFSTQSRQGYFGGGGGEPNTASNADAKAGEPRIVLHDQYGQAKEAEKNHAATTGQKRKAEAEVEKVPEWDNVVGLAGRYEGKCVVVTGGSKGIGEGCSRVFFEAGANIVVAARSAKEGDALVSELNAKAEVKEKATNRCIFVQTDVSKVDDLKRLIEKAVEHFGRLDCLINNAGWHPPPLTIEQFSVEEMQDLFQLNFISIFAACKFALPHLRKVRGNIINMSSWVGAFGQAQAPTYSATKGAITAFSKSLAIDEATSGQGVRVNIVSPGNIWTPLWKSWSDGEPDPVAAKEAGDRVQVMGRKGTIMETGRLCLCIAADLTFTTGVDHLQSGGAELGYGVKA